MRVLANSKAHGLSTKVWENSSHSKQSWLKTKRTSCRSMSLEDKSACKMPKSVIPLQVRLTEQPLFTMAPRINSQVGIKVSSSLHHTSGRKTTRRTSQRNGFTPGTVTIKEYRGSSFSLNSVIYFSVPVMMAQSKSGTSWPIENVCARTWAIQRQCVTFSSQMMVGSSSARVSTKLSSCGTPKQVKSFAALPTVRHLSVWSSTQQRTSNTSSWRVVPTRKSCNSIQTQKT